MRLPQPAHGRRSSLRVTVTFSSLGLPEKRSQARRTPAVRAQFSIPMKMTNSPLKFLVVGLCLAGVPVALLAQAGVPSTPPQNAELRPVVPSNPAQPAPLTYELTAAWNSRTQAHSVPLANDSDKQLEVLGVQSSSGIFLVDFPQKIAAKKSDSIGFVYHAADNTDGDLDLIRVLTDQGIKDILVKIVRESAVKFDTRELQWTAGDALEAKSATITVTTGTVTPQKVRVAGGHQAVLEAAGANTWKVKITPASTAKSGKFVVSVDFDQPLPGTAPVILGVIRPKE